MEDKIKKLLDVFSVFLILGARQVGKTVLSKRVTTEDWRYFDLEKPEDFEAIHRNPTFFSSSTLITLLLMKPKNIQNCLEFCVASLMKTRIKRGVLF